MLSYLDVFRTLAYAAFGMIGLIFFLKKSKPGENVEVAH
jgi:hypothetical protein